MLKAFHTAVYAPHPNPVSPFFQKSPSTTWNGGDRLSQEMNPYRSLLCASLWKITVGWVVFASRRLGAATKNPPDCAPPFAPTATLSTRALPTRNQNTELRWTSAWGVTPFTFSLSSL